VVIERRHDYPAAAKGLSTGSKRLGGRRKCGRKRKGELLEERWKTVGYQAKLRRR